MTSTTGKLKQVLTMVKPTSMRGLRWWGRGIDCTLDLVMDLGEHHPKSTILVPIFDAVPIRAIGGASQRSVHGHRSQLEYA
jgi:hypothetical protein